MERSNSPLTYPICWSYAPRAAPRTRPVAIPCRRAWRSLATREVRAVRGARPRCLRHRLSRPRHRARSYRGPEGPARRLSRLARGSGPLPPRGSAAAQLDHPQSSGSTTSAATARLATWPTLRAGDDAGPVRWPTAGSPSARPPRWSPRWRRRCTTRTPGRDPSRRQAREHPARRSRASRI